MFFFSIKMRYGVLSGEQEKDSIIRVRLGKKKSVSRDHR